MAEMEKIDSDQLGELVNHVFEEVPAMYAANIRDLLLAGARSPKHLEKITGLVAEKIKIPEEASKAVSDIPVSVEAASVTAGPVTALLDRAMIVETEHPEVKVLTEQLRSSMQRVVVQPVQSHSGRPEKGTAVDLWDYITPGSSDEPAVKIKSLAGLSREEFIQRCEVAQPPLKFDDLEKGPFRVASVSSPNVDQVSQLLMGLGINIWGRNGEKATTIIDYSDSLDDMVPPTGLPVVTVRRTGTQLYDAEETRSGYATFIPPDNNQVKISLQKIERKDHDGNPSTVYGVDFFTTGLGIQDLVRSGRLNNSPTSQRVSR